MYYLTKNRKTMKKISVLMAAFMAVCMSALADDVVSVNPNPIQVSPGDVVELEIVFENANGNYKGFQLDITMPEGISAEIDEGEIVCDKGDLYGKKDDHAISADHTASGADRFVCASLSNKTISSGKGVVLVVSYKVSESIATGEYTGKLSAIEFNTSDEKSVLFEDVEFKVLVVPTKINDVSASKQTIGIYNVAGQQVEMQKGINIVDGKKVIIR